MAREFDVKKETSISVKDIMTEDVITLPKDATIHQAAKMMANSQIGCLIVGDGTEIDGIITERDLVTKVLAEKLDPDETTLEQVMTKKVIHIHGDMEVTAASELMTAKNFRRLPVVNSKRELIGVVTEKDLLRIEPKLVDILRKMLRLRAKAKSKDSIEDFYIHRKLDQLKKGWRKRGPA